MEAITRKPVLRQHLDLCLAAYHNGGVNGCADALHREILSKKIKFPLLEFAAQELHRHIPEQDHLPLLERVEALRTIGGNVILGMMLQCRLESHFHQSLEKATEFTSRADVWYICDIIGERVFGFAMLRQPELALPEIERLSRHPSRWVVRSLGAGAHYAIKKGLDRDHVERLFQLLLSLAANPDKEIRQGIGWAAKTTAKFHPDIIEQYRDQIADPKLTGGWFRTKVDIGLKRNSYAQGN